MKKILRIVSIAVFATSIQASPLAQSKCKTACKCLDDAMHAGQKYEEIKYFQHTVKSLSFIATAKQSKSEERCSYGALSYLFSDIMGEVENQPYGDSIRGKEVEAAVIYLALKTGERLRIPNYREELTSYVPERLEAKLAEIEDTLDPENIAVLVNNPGLLVTELSRLAGENVVVRSSIPYYRNDR